MKVFASALVVFLVGCPRAQSSQDAAVAASRDAGTVDAGPSADAAVADAAHGDAADPCMGVTTSGRCDGGVLEYCDDRTHTFVSTDCEARSRRCELQTELGGYWCVGGVGQACEVNQTDVCAAGLLCQRGLCSGVLDAGMADSGS